MKYIQQTDDNRHVIKIKGTNIVLSDEDLPKLSKFINDMIEMKLSPEFPPRGTKNGNI